MFEQAFKNIDADLRDEAGCTTELDYTEQTSWLLVIVEYLKFARSFNRAFPGFATDIHGLVEVEDQGQVRYYMDCVRA